MDIKIGENVHVPSPNHGFIKVKVVDVKKEDNKIISVKVSYVDDFIKKEYGDENIIYTGDNIHKIIKNTNEELPNYWMFHNRKEFPEWVTKTFLKYDSCKKQEKSKSFDFLPRQKFIRDYLSHNSPYRGLLLYHGLGVGKTCASIAVSENLKDTRNIIILLPKSLEDNFKKKGLKYCGDPKYKNENGNKHINEKYTFISHNSASFIKKIQEVGSLDNKVIIVDEAHNVATKIVNGLRGTGKQGIEIYKLLLEAKNSKIVFLTGTPLVNTPFEIAIMFNILRGFLEVNIFKIINLQNNVSDSYKSALLQDNRIEWVDINHRNQTMSVILSVNSWDMEFEQSIRTVESTAKEYNSKIYFDRTIKNTLFPDNEDEFENFFIRDDSFINKDMFQRRIIGLTSYFETTEETKKEFPEQFPTKLVEVKMSDYQYERYQQARDFERPIERRAAQKLSTDRKQKITTTARVFSREFSNFVFPDIIERPFKKVVFLSKKMDNELLNNNNENVYKLQKKIEKSNEELDDEIRKSLIKLSDDTKPYLKAGKEGLSKYSPKMEAMLQEIKKDEKGLVFVYSSFRNVEGLEIFSLILNANGYVPYNKTNIQKEDDYKRFAIYSGSEDIKVKNMIIDTYSNSENKYGKDIRLLLVSSAGAEGLDLKNIRKVLIMDVYWHDIRIQQIIGRAVRKDSHIDLPIHERNVQPIIYLSIFTEEQKEQTKEKLSTDEYIYELSKKKLKLNNEILESVKESAIDCMLNQCKNKDKCFQFEGKKEELAYIPRIEDDILYGYKKKKKRELIVAGVTDKNKIVYKKDNLWYTANGEEIKKPNIKQGIKYGFNKDTFELFDFNKIKKGIEQKVGFVNQKTSEIKE